MSTPWEGVGDCKIQALQRDELAHVTRQAEYGDIPIAAFISMQKWMGTAWSCLGMKIHIHLRPDVLSAIWPLHGWDHCS